MLAEEGFRKVHQVRNRPVTGIRPEGGELKAVAGLRPLRLLRLGIIGVVEAGGVGIVLGVCTIGDDKNLHKLIQAAGCPEAIPLVAVNLIERLPNGHAPALQLNVHQGQAIDQHRYIIAVIMGSPFLGGNGILMDDLQAIVVDVLFINEPDVLALPVVPVEHLHFVLLNQLRLFHHAAILFCQHFPPEPFPFAIGKDVSIQLFQLGAQVSNQVGLLVDGKVFIAQLPQQAEELIFQVGFALVRLRAPGLGGVLGDNGAFLALGNDIEIHDEMSN